MKVKILHNIPTSGILDPAVTILEVIHLQQHTEIAHKQAEKLKKLEHPHLYPCTNYNGSSADCYFSLCVEKYESFPKTYFRNPTILIRFVYII